MKAVKVALSDGSVLCPCCGYRLTVGATVRLKAHREIGQMTIGPEPGMMAVPIEEAERHG